MASSKTIEIITKHDYIPTYLYSNHIIVFFKSYEFLSLLKEDFSSDYNTNDSFFMNVSQRKVSLDLSAYGWIGDISTKNKNIIKLFVLSQIFSQLRDFLFFREKVINGNTSEEIKKNIEETCFQILDNIFDFDSRAFFESFSHHDKITINIYPDNQWKLISRIFDTNFKNWDDFKEKNIYAIEFLRDLIKTIDEQPTALINDYVLSKKNNYLELNNTNSCDHKDIREILDQWIEVQKTDTMDLLLIGSLLDLGSLLISPKCFSKDSEFELLPLVKVFKETASSVKGEKITIYTFLNRENGISVKFSFNNDFFSQKIFVPSEKCLHPNYSFITLNKNSVVLNSNHDLNEKLDSKIIELNILVKENICSKKIKEYLNFLNSEKKSMINVYIDKKYFKKCLIENIIKNKINKLYLIFSEISTETLETLREIKIFVAKKRGYNRYIKQFSGSRKDLELIYREKYVRKIVPTFVFNNLNYDLFEKIIETSATEEYMTDICLIFNLENPLSLKNLNKNINYVSLKYCDSNIEKFKLEKEIKKRSIGSMNRRNLGKIYFPQFEICIFSHSHLNKNFESILEFISFLENFSTVKNTVYNEFNSTFIGKNFFQNICEL